MKKILFGLFIFVTACTTQVAKKYETTQIVLKSMVKDSLSVMTINITNDTAYITINYQSGNYYSAMYDVAKITDSAGHFTIPDSSRFWYMEFNRNKTPELLLPRLSGDVTCYCDPKSKTCLKEGSNGTFICISGGKDPCRWCGCMTGVDLYPFHYGCGVIFEAQHVVYNDVIY